jgi:hypothetical protein
MRQNGHGALTLEDARTWIEETGLCLFLPRRQFSASVAPSFVEAVAGHQNSAPDPAHIALAEELLVRLELADVAVRLNLLGQPGEQPDFVVASWVLPYVYALRGDRDWRRSPQLTGSRQVSQLAVQAYKLLEAGDTTIADLKQTLGREVTETAVLRAITELWQQLRIIPVIAAPGAPAKWQLLRHRFQKAIAEGASTSQVTAISVLASIYLQAVIAASMEEVEIFLASLTARSKVREVLRGLVATRQVHTISLGHSPHYYVAGTLPEFAVPTNIYASSSMPASAYFMRSQELEEDLPEVPLAKAAPPVSSQPAQPEAGEARAPRPSVARKPATNGKPAAARPHFSRPATQTRDRKPAQGSSSSRPARRSASDSRPAPTRQSTSRPATSRPTTARPTGSHSANSSRPAPGSRWKSNPPAGAKTKQNGNGIHAGTGTGKTSHAGGNGALTNGNGSRSSNGKSGARPAKPTVPAWGQRNGGSNGAKSTAKPAANGHSNSAQGNGNNARKDTRTDARPSRNGASRKPTLAAGTKAGNSKRYGFTARPKQETKKRG